MGHHLHNCMNTSNIRTSNNGRILQILATEEFNDANIACAVLTLDHSQSEDLFSEPAVLRVQGMKTVLIPCNHLLDCMHACSSTLLEATMQHMRFLKVGNSPLSA